ncbi:MAG: hypothetical protein HC897_10905 [Thermoanaerobaculia bacterium]|nr:hypothetical protein [Thermoanaerobaculia bacterium]
MLLPKAINAYVPPEKLVEYVLSEKHAVGREKARFFRAHGYDDTTAALLARDLLEIARRNRVRETLSTPFGIKYVIGGTLSTPRGTLVAVTTVWIVEADSERPRFVTVLPREKR